MHLRFGLQAQSIEAGSAFLLSAWARALSLRSLEGQSLPCSAEAPSKAEGEAEGAGILTLKRAQPAKTYIQYRQFYWNIFAPFAPSQGLPFSHHQLPSIVRPGRVIHTIRSAQNCTHKSQNRNIVHQCSNWNIPTNVPMLDPPPQRIDLPLPGS
jgi:hypothetical protein